MNIFDLTVLILFFTSIVLLIFIWFIYLTFRISIKHPNFMFLAVVTVQIIEMSLLIFQIIYFDRIPLYSSIYGPTGVMVTMYMLRFTKVLAVHYMASIIIEIFIKVRKSLRVNYKTRIMFYHIYNFCASCLFTIFGRTHGDKFLPFYPIGRLFYSIYMISICIVLIFLINYFYLKHRKKVKSKDFISLTVMIGLSIIIVIIQIVLGLLFNSRLSETNHLNFLSYLLNSLEGAMEFIVFYFSGKMKNLFLNAFEIFSIKKCRRRQNSRFGNVSLAMLSKDAQYYKLSETSLGFFSDVFENMTTSVSFI